jgi:hypothetical protein
MRALVLVLALSGCAQWSAFVAAVKQCGPELEIAINDSVTVIGEAVSVAGVVSAVSSLPAAIVADKGAVECVIDAYKAARAAQKITPQQAATAIGMLRAAQQKAMEPATQ